MAVTAKQFGQASKYVWEGEVKWLAAAGSTVKCMLVDDSYSFDQDAHGVLSDVTAHDIGTQGNYAAGGVAMTLVDAAYATGTLTLDANDILILTSTITAYGAIVYVSSGSVHPLLAYVNFGGAKTSTSPDNFAIVWSASGVMSVAVTV